MRIVKSSSYRDEVYDLLCEMQGSTVMNLLSDYLGMQFIDDAFIEFLESEGVLELIDEGATA